MSPIAAQRTERRQRADDERVARLETWSEGHEKLCAERAGQVLFRMKRIEALLIGAAIGLIGALWWVIQFAIDHIGDAIIQKIGAFH